MSVLRFIIIGLLIVGVIALGGVVGNLVAKEPGYVLMAYDGQSVETSLWVAALLLVATYIFIRLLFALLAWVWRSPTLLGRWTSKRRHQGAAARTTQGMLLMAEGDWAEAQRALTAAAANAQSPLMNYLTAARAAANLGNREQRDELLEKAMDSTPGSKLAVGLARAEMQQEAGQWEASVQQLAELREMSPRHPAVQRLYVNGLQQSGQHQVLAEELTALRKSKALSKAEYKAVEEATAAAQLTSQVDDAGLRALYQGLAKATKTAPSVVLALGTRALAITATASEGADSTALTEVVEPALKSAIDKDPSGPLSDEMLNIYGRLAGAESTRLSSLERWQKKIPQHAGLHLAIARVHTAQGDEAGAQAAITKSLDLQASGNNPQWKHCVELARLCCAHGDAERALACLEQGQPTGLVGSAADPEPTDAEAIEGLAASARGAA